jgi:hypothetical protein
LKKVNCKTTFEGVYQFSYLSRESGGGICNSPKSLIKACQEPGSPYVDNEVFDMYFGFCPAITSSFKQGEQVFFQMYASSNLQTYLHKSRKVVMLS